MTLVEPAPAHESTADADATAFARALERETPLLLAAARALVRSEVDARDLVQTTLEIAVRKAASLRDSAAIRPWLLAIQVREAFRLRRRLARIVRFDPTVADMRFDPVAAPDDDILALRAALASLPTRARTAIVLHYLVDLPVDQVAGVMGISENTTKGHLKAGLARLRRELRDE